MNKGEFPELLEFGEFSEPLEKGNYDHPDGD
jgi:hypothetical protein